MSRSFKKHPIVKDKNKDMKNHANRKVRRNIEDIPSGKSYRKTFETYDVCDYIDRETEAETRERIVQDIKSVLNGETVQLSKLVHLNVDLSGLDMDNLTYEELEKRMNLNEWRKSYREK